MCSRKLEERLMLQEGSQRYPQWKKYELLMGGTKMFVEHLGFVVWSNGDHAIRLTCDGKEEDLVRKWR